MESVHDLARILGSKPGQEVQVVRSFEDNGLVFAHAAVNYAGLGQWITTQLLVLDENDEITRSWVATTPATPPNSTGRTQLDGVTEIRDVELTEENKQLVADFFGVVLETRNLDYFNDFISPAFIQHAPDMGEGSLGLWAFLNTPVGAGPHLAHERLIRLVGCGNFVVGFSHARNEEGLYKVFDVFRIEHGLIAEHWDNIEPIRADMPSTRTPLRFG